ncbi:MAG: OadG family protein [Rubrivivax sp.]|nr:OadG family protein [Rubrivivax sp.]
MNDLGWGLQISVLGMGLVFALLALLWGLLTLVLRFDRPEAPAAPGASAAAGEVVATAGEATATSAAAQEPALEPGLEPGLVAAITAAVLAHVSQRRKAAVPDLRIHWPGSLLHASRWVASGRLRQNRTFRKGRG